LDYLAIRGTEVISSGRNLHNIQLDDHLKPATDNVYMLGDSSLRWANIWSVLLNVASIANVGSLQIGATTVIDSSRKLTNIASIIQSLLPDADNRYDLGSSSYRWRHQYLSGKLTTAQLIVTDQIRDNTDTCQMAKIVLASGTSRNMPAWVFFPTYSDYSLLPTTSNYGYIGESDQYWYMMYSRYYYYKVAPASFSCPSKLKEVPLDRALSVKVEEKKLSKGLKVRYKAPTPHSEDAYTVKDLIRERLGFNMAPLEREYTKHLLQKHNGDFESALREAKEFFGEELENHGRAIKERLEKKMPIEDEVALDELVSVYGEQAVAEALEILKFELHDQIEVA
jgi:hypothetical protein